MFRTDLWALFMGVTKESPAADLLQPLGVIPMPQEYVYLYWTSLSLPVLSLSVFPVAVMKYPDKRNLRETWFPLTVEGTVHHDGEVMAAGAWTGAAGQEPESSECLHSDLSFSSNPEHGL